MRRSAWEFKAVIAALRTSTLRPGNCDSNCAWRKRGMPNPGSGSPKAADSPKTSTRSVPVSFFSRIFSGRGIRARVSPTYGAPKAGLARSIPSPASNQKAVGR